MTPLPAVNRARSRRPAARNGTTSRSLRSQREGPRENGAGSGAATGGTPARCPWCPSRSATPGSRWDGSPSSSRCARGSAYTVMWFFSDFFHPGYEGAVARTEEVLYLRHRHAADGFRAGLPAGPARVHVPHAHAPPGDPRQPRPVLRRPAADADHDHPLLPGGGAGDPHHAAVGRAAGVPGQAGGPAHRRPVRAQEPQGQGAAGVRPGAAGEDRAAAGRAGPPVRRRDAVVRDSPCSAASSQARTR